MPSRTDGTCSPSGGGLNEPGGALPQRLLTDVAPGASPCAGASAKPGAAARPTGRKKPAAYSVSKFNECHLPCPVWFYGGFLCCVVVAARVLPVSWRQSRLASARAVAASPFLRFSGWYDFFCIIRPQKPFCQILFRMCLYLCLRRQVKDSRKREECQPTKPKSI